MAAHSRLGASSAKRWMTCPGSFALVADADAGAPRGSVYSAAGTVAHQLAERMLEQRLWVADSALGDVHHVQGHVVAVDREMVDAVNDYLVQVYARTLVQAGSPRIKVGCETRVSLARWWRDGEQMPPTPMFGTADTWIYNEAWRQLCIIDFKYGSGVYVPVEDNPQLLYYAAGVLASQSFPVVHTIEMVVVQPRAREGDAVRSHTIDVLDLRLWIDRTLKPAVAAVAAPDAPLVTGTHCRFCDARPTCPAYADRAQAAARAEFADDPIEEGA